MLDYVSLVQKERLSAHSRSLSKFADTENASTAISKDRKTQLDSEASLENGISVKSYTEQVEKGGNTALGIFAMLFSSLMTSINLLGFKFMFAEHVELSAV